MTHKIYDKNSTFLFVGSRLEVLNAMIKHCKNVLIALQEGTYAAKIMADKADLIFSSKKELLSFIDSAKFDVLVSNGCPYILPISQLKKPHQIFINIHPSLLPNLKGAHPINAAILFSQPTGASCHIMNDEIDSGPIISQIPVHNDKNTPLILLYQMCFLAEKEAFLQALNNGFTPLENLDSKQNLNAKTPQIPYYTRSDDDLVIDFSKDTKFIIWQIKAFASASQKARFYIDNKCIKVAHAMKIKNAFLASQFRESKHNDIILRYENCILLKRKNHFLQLSLEDSLPLHISNLSNAEKSHVEQGETSNISCHVECNETSTPTLCHVEQSETSTLKSCANPPIHPIFSTKEYAKSLLDSNSKALHFSYENDAQSFANTAIVESIPKQSYFDASSPYGYGGYISNSQSSEFLKLAFASYSAFARAHNIIAEFIRFHPLLSCLHYKPFLHFFHKERDIVCVSTDFSTRWEHYSQRLKGKLRKSLNSLEIVESKDLDKFIHLYTQTMQRNNASPFYFFKRSYFENLLRLNSIMLEARFSAQTAAMGIFLFDSLCGYYHLGANAPISLNGNLNAMGALFEAFFELAYKMGLKKCILGGGRSADEKDSLFLYKKQFATQILPFFIGGNVFDKQAFTKLTAANPNNMFLSYRFDTANIDVDSTYRGGAVISLKQGYFHTTSFLFSTNFKNLCEGAKCA